MLSFITSIYATYIDELKKECNKDVANACEALGSMYSSDFVGKAKNNKTAFNYILKAARLGLTEAQYNIGVMYSNGTGTKKSAKKALYWYRKSANQGHISAQYNLGIIYYYGNDVEKNQKNAFFWFKKAAEQGFDRAQLYVGQAYILGEGTKVNYSLAYKWSLKSAKQGLNSGQYMVGRIFYYGKGIPVDYTKAYAWFKLAQANGLKGLSEKISFIENKLSPMQLSIAQNFNPMIQDQPNRSKPIAKKKHIQPKVPIQKSTEPIIYAGTGFFVDSTTIITNNHVTKNCKNFDLVRKGYKTKAILIANDVKNDLALLKTDKPNSKYLKFRIGKGIRLGNKVLVLGYPLGHIMGSNLKLTTGNISSLTGLFDDTASLQITAPVQPGNSGGPLLDTSGNIIGVVFAKLAKKFSAENVNLAIKANLVQMFLDINNIDYSVAMSETHKDSADIADDAMNSVVKILCTQ